MQNATLFGLLKIHKMKAETVIFNNSVKFDNAYISEVSNLTFWDVCIRTISYTALKFMAQFCAQKLV